MMRLRSGWRIITGKTAGDIPESNAPTGILMPLDKIEDIIAHNRDVIVVVDEGVY